MKKNKEIHIDELELWKKVKSDDLNAFYEFYTFFYPKLKYIANQLHCNDEIAKDLIHDTFVEIYERRSMIEIKSSLKYYLIRSFKSHLSKHLNSLNRLSKVKKEQEFEPAFTISFQTELIEKQHLVEKLSQVETAINELTNRQREALYYFYKEGLDYDEITEVMSLKTRRSSQNLIYEAIKVLRSKILFYFLILEGTST
ncbi:MAG: sigma-70 family RNA polymerase sigma factor [Cyclobacteriaceae bacterium]